MAIPRRRLAASPPSRVGEGQVGEAASGNLVENGRRRWRAGGNFPSESRTASLYGKGVLGRRDGREARTDRCVMTNES